MSQRETDLAESEKKYEEQFKSLELEKENSEKLLSVKEAELDKLLQKLASAE